ncbi:heterogeneous nuclear ribonucleoproteins A2/B1-like [Petaurus breviceps papuanus]|uniref:heterogeneous nuclear ribonucleoproteins A2/B1-like n=1 Tax=Petaurus breviceps papuanus TaxID=3040969 RepID=UPI0036DE3EF2
MATAPVPQAAMKPSRSLNISMLGNRQLCKLFVGRLHPNTDEAGLRQHFEAFGTLTKCVVMMNLETNRSRCFGFITFSSANEADRAMAASPHVVDGCPVELKRALSREESCKPGAHLQVKAIFVGGLKGDVGERDLVRHFSQFGPVEKAKIIINKQSGKKCGFGFVHFVDYDSAEKAAVVKFHPIQGHQVEVKKALPRENLDPWGLDQPVPRSSSTWKLSSQAHAGGPDSKSAGGQDLKPDGDSDPKFDVSLIPPLAWVPCYNPAWFPSHSSGLVPHQKCGWEPDPKSVEGPNPKPVEGPNPKPVGGLTCKPTGEIWVPEAKPGIDPASNPVLTSKFGPSLGPGLGPKIGPGLNLGYGPKPEPNPNSGLGPNPKPGLLGPGPGLGRGSGPCRHGSRGNYEQNDHDGNCNQYGVSGTSSENKTSHNYSQYRAKFGHTKRGWCGWARQGESSRGPHRGGASGSGGH